MIKNIGKFVYGFVVFALFLIAGLTAISALNIPGNYKLMVVMSGSMEPSIRTGSVVVVQPKTDYQKGDVITFRDVAGSRSTVTHRIFEAKDGSFLTKGDANNAPDSAEINKGQILGRVAFVIPFIGYPVSFAKTQRGLIILVVIPAVIIIYNELITIKNEAVRLVKERRTRKLNAKEEIEEKIGEEIITLEKGLKRMKK
jgi:signal peptidase I